jgi:hypothetical protein
VRRPEFLFGRDGKSGGTSIEISGGTGSIEENFKGGCTQVQGAKSERSNEG